MNPAPTPGSYRRRKLMLTFAALAAASMLAAGCSSSPSHSSGGNNSTSAQNSGSARETAETRLAQIGAQLGAVLADYQVGQKARAHTLAKSVSANLYEGTTEGIVSSIDPAVERQIDSLLAATLPGAIQNGESVSQVAVLVHRAQSLAASGLAAIHKSES